MNKMILFILLLVNLLLAEPVYILNKYDYVKKQESRNIIFGGNLIYGNYKSSGTLDFSIRFNQDVIIKKFVKELYGIEISTTFPPVEMKDSLDSKYDETRIGFYVKTGIGFNKYFSWYGSGLLVPSSQDLNFVLTSIQNITDTLILPTSINGSLFYLSPLTFEYRPVSFIIGTLSLGGVIELGKMKTQFLSIDNIQFIHAGPSGFVNIEYYNKIFKWMDINSGFFYFYGYCPSINDFKITDDYLYEINLSLGKRNIQFVGITFGINIYF